MFTNRLRILSRRLFRSKLFKVVVGGTLVVLVLRTEIVSDKIFDGLCAVSMVSRVQEQWVSSPDRSVVARIMTTNQGALGGKGTSVVLTTWEALRLGIEWPRNSPQVLYLHGLDIADGCFVKPDELHITWGRNPGSDLRISLDKVQFMGHSIRVTQSYSNDLYDKTSEWFPSEDADIQACIMRRPSGTCRGTVTGVYVGKPKKGYMDKYETIPLSGLQYALLFDGERQLTVKWNSPRELSVRAPGTSRVDVLLYKDDLNAVRVRLYIDDKEFTPRDVMSR